MADSKIAVDTIDYAAIKKELDDFEGGLDECHCSDCKKIIEAAVMGDWYCEVCGYPGEPFAYECACYDHHCNPSTPGTGCFHGSVSCPLCDGGERTDAVARVLMRTLRRALRGPDDHIEVHAQRYEEQGLPLYAKAVRLLKSSPCDGPAEKKAKPLISPSEKSKNPAGSGVADSLPFLGTSADEASVIFEKARAQIAAMTRQLDLLSGAALRGSKAIRMALKWMDTLPDGEVPEFGLDDAVRDLEKTARLKP